MAASRFGLNREDRGVRVVKNVCIQKVLDERDNKNFIVKETQSK